MGKLDIIQSLEIKTNAEKAWEIIGPNFINIGDWGRGIYKSWKNEDAAQDFSDAPSGGRFCDVAGFGKFDERIIHFDATKYEISWSAMGEKLPKFISDLQNELKVEAIDKTSCRITTHITANLSGLKGLLFGSVIKKNFSKTINGFLKDWKAYAETGQVSEAKQREIDRSAKHD